MSCKHCLLDVDNYVFVYVFPIMAILGVLSIFLLTKINFPFIKEDDDIVKGVKISSSINVNSIEE